MADFIGIREAIRILLHRRWWIVAGAMVGGLVGLYFALNSTPRYRADVLLQPIKRSGSSGAIQALSGQLGGLASLAGLSLGEGDDTSAAIATLRSRLLTNTFITERNLMPVLFEGLWDKERGQWKVKKAIDTPTLWAAEQVFASRVRKITENRSGGLITLSIEWTDPNVAAEWATGYVLRANSLLRDEARKSAQTNIDFLEKQLKTTDIVEVRQTLNGLMEEQLKRLMLAQGDSEYAFKTIDPAVVPVGKVNMPRKRVVIVWFFAGILLAGIAAFFERVLWQSKE